MTIHDLVEQVRESQRLASRFMVELPRFEIDGVGELILPGSGFAFAKRHLR